MIVTSRSSWSHWHLSADNRVALAASLAGATVVAFALLHAPTLVSGLVVALALSVVFSRRPAVFALTYIGLIPIMMTFGVQLPIMGQEGKWSLNLMGLSNLAVLGYGGIALIRHRREINWRAIWPVVILPAYLLLTVIRSTEPIISARSWVSYGVPSMLALLLSIDTESKTLLRRAGLALVACGITSAILGGWQLASWDLTYEFNGLPRIAGGHGHPNTYAMFLLISILAAQATILRARYVTSRVLLGSAMTIQLVLLLFTFSRTGWIALAACLIIGSLRVTNQIVVGGLIATCVVVPLAGELVPLVVSRFQPDPSFYMRFALIELGLEVFRGAPLFGHGVGSFSVLSREAYGPIVERYGVSVGLAPHNDVIRFLVEAGLVGLLLYLALVAQIARLGISLARSDDKDRRALGTFLTCGTLGTVVFGVGGQGLAYSALYLLPTFGMAAAMIRREKVTGSQLA